MNAPWRVICLEIPLLKKMFLLPSTISVWKCHPLERWSILLCGLGSDSNWYWQGHQSSGLRNLYVCLLRSSVTCLAQQRETQSLTHLRVLLLHAASEAVKAAGWEGAGRSYLQTAFFTIKIPCSSRFVWILNNTSTGWEHWQIQTQDTSSSRWCCKAGQGEKHDTSVKHHSQLGLTKLWVVSLITPRNPSKCIVRCSKWKPANTPDV